VDLSSFAARVRQTVYERYHRFLQYTIQIIAGPKTHFKENNMMISETLLAWMAGIIDGEGSICLTRNGTKERLSPVIEVPNTQPELVTIFKEYFGGSIGNKKIYKPHHTPSLQWKLTNRGAIDTMKLLRPYMRHPLKCKRIDLIVSDYLKVTPRNGRYNQQTLSKKEAFEKAFYELK
jgi:hypothetical protein